MKNTTKYFVKKIFGEFYSINPKLFLLIAVFSFYSTHSLSALDSSGCSAFEYALYGMSDHYYIVFFFLPVYITTMIRTVNDKNELIMVRNSRFHVYFVSKLTAMVLFTISIIFFHAVIVTIIGFFKHGFGGGFSSMVGPLVSFAELSMIFRSAFQTPLPALVAVCLYLTLGLCVCLGIIMLISHHLSDKAVILTSACGYLLIIVTLHLNIDKFAPFLFINNYLFLHRAIGYGIPTALIAISAILMVLFTFAANRQRLYCLKWAISRLLPISTFGEVLQLKGIISLLIASLSLATFGVIKHNAVASSGLEHTAMLFWGYGTGYLNIVDLLHLIILNGIPLYVLSAYLGNKESMRSVVMIRYRYRQKWFAVLQRSTLKLVFFYLILLCLCSFLAGSLFSSSGVFEDSSMSTYLTNSSAPTIIIGFVLRTLEIMFIQMVLIVMISLSNNTTISFLLAMSTYLFTITMLSSKFIPFGLSSICRILELSNSDLYVNSLIAGTIFIALYAIMYLYTRKFGIKRILDCERN